MTVKGDRVQIEQVILNLVADAIDAVAERRDNFRRVMVRSHLLGETMAQLTVSDSGPGIPAEALKQIFERSTRQRSQAGGGAIFRLTLPVSVV